MPWELGVAGMCRGGEASLELPLSAASGTGPAKGNAGFGALVWRDTMTRVVRLQFILESRQENRRKTCEAEEGEEGEFKPREGRRMGEACQVSSRPLQL